MEEKPESDKHDNEGEVAGRILNRAEIAEIAQAMMPAALKKLQTVLHQSGSDLAVLQAFRALKDAAYGKDAQATNISIDLESLSEDELKSAIFAELWPGITPDGDDVERATQTPATGQPD